jgi:Zn finger protein HypA/HybF involved in hydrogenase expression
VVRSLLANGDELYQFTQLKASLRLLRDDETIDKELLGYADRAISMRFNSLLKEAVPKVEKTERSVGEMLSVTDDPLLRSARDHRYLVKLDDVSIPFEELRYWSVDGGYALSLSDNRNSTVVSKEEGGHYLVKCPKCDDQAVRLIKRGDQLQAIACSKCRTRLIRIDSPRAPRRHRRATRSV